MLKILNIWINAGGMNYAGDAVLICFPVALNLHCCCCESKLTTAVVLRERGSSTHLYFLLKRWLLIVGFI